jgi:hypothetical protein|tara:strand:+ start:6084 stop:6587 length:504 start_codon:yes stop_codon:yes gene_type:complete
VKDKPGYDNVKFFIGQEVENTFAKGEDTLFVNGYQPLEEILSRALNEKCGHIHICYFDPVRLDQWKLWETLLLHILENNVILTLDYDVKYAEDIFKLGLHDFSNFIPIISTILPSSSKYNFNTVFKIADKGFDKTNEGTWSMHFNKLLDEEYFNPWSNYTKGDKPVE